MDNKYKFFDYIKIFKIKENVLLRYYYKLIKDPSFHLECSYKKKNNMLYSSRFNLFCNKNFNTNLTKINNFVNLVNKIDKIKLNQSLLKKIFKEIKIKKISQIACGIDIRDKIEDSRIKVWIQLINYPEKVKEYLNLVNANDEMKEFFSNNNIVIGADLFLNGRTYFKYYSFYFYNTFTNPVLKKYLCHKVLELMKYSEGIFVHFRWPKFNKMIYFKVRDHHNFLKNIPKVSFDPEHYEFINRGYNIGWISFFHEELVTNKISEFNVYY